MRLAQVQQARLSQQLRLAPRMIQSMEILQLPMIALEERIEQELESNVALDRADGSPDEQQIAEERREDEAEEELAGKPLVVAADGSPGVDDFRRLGDLESSYVEAFDSDATWERPRAIDPDGRDRKLEAMANAPARSESLIEQARRQWAFADEPEEIAEAGRLLIEYLDDDGRIGADLETIREQAASGESGWAGAPPTVAVLESALESLQRTLEPPGLAARDVRESLILQAQALREAASPIERPVWEDVERLLVDHYDDLLQNRLPKIERDGGISMERIAAAKVQMARLRLTPGRDLVDADVPPIVPDAVVEFDEAANRYVAAVTDGRLPPLRVSPRYERMARDRSVDAQTREYLAGSVRSAEWLIDSIAQRRATLLKVVELVIEKQREFLDHGPAHLRPLPMTEIADALGVHVATVSRAVADKWLQTPRGLVPLRRLFSGGRERDGGGEEMSWEAVRQLVREIVDAEDPPRPLSDQAIADALKARGVTIARRTVVKYREQLDIPPARRRKRHA
ncbi:MAG TPA: RNA polymerase factor sigma-54 [Phycisphaerales bacterium]|nr:RNA polymerase factor sigma-54 [Phycisphaerales bacterium]HMP37670.1 RNA polymerase factor sigma-54 [Phycisphaerales bacterium]